MLPNFEYTRSQTHLPNVGLGMRLGFHKTSVCGALSSQYTMVYFHLCFRMQIVYGVKGKSVFHSLPGFDVIRNNPVDYMHCVLLGVVRTLLSLWFESKYHRKQWSVIIIAYNKWWCSHVFLCKYRYIGNKIKEADAKLAGIKPPDVVIRKPKSFRGREWKGNYSFAIDTNNVTHQLFYSFIYSN